MKVVPSKNQSDMKKVKVIPNNHPHLKYAIVVDGKKVAEHAELETSQKHKAKILRPLPVPKYKGKILIK